MRAWQTSDETRRHRIRVTDDSHQQVLVGWRCAASYQACVLPQCGQETLVETGAMKKHPHAHG
jgi:hypothetical protein